MAFGWLLRADACGFIFGMTEDKRVAESKDTAEMAKRPYASPTLSRLGSLAELTHTSGKGGTKNDPGGGLSKL